MDECRLRKGNQTRGIGGGEGLRIYMERRSINRSQNSASRLPNIKFINSFGLDTEFGGVIEIPEVDPCDLLGGTCRGEPAGGALK